jgi:hypothetical protein
MPSIEPMSNAMAGVARAKAMSVVAISFFI